MVKLAFALTGHAGRSGVFEGNGIDIGIIRKQHQGYEDEKPFHGRPPFAAGAASHVFPPLKVTGITQIADRGPTKLAIYKSVIPVTFTHAKP